MTATETGTLIPYLVEMFRLQAWVAMGKIVHPATGKIERDLGAARLMIDLLAELETRTEGNRSDDETRLLRGALTDLRLNYLEEVKKPVEEPERAGAGSGDAATESHAKPEEEMDTKE